MKIKHLFLAAFAALATVFTSCEKEEDLGAPQITVNPTEISFDSSASSKEVTLKATRAWTATAPEWIALSATSGDASSSEKTISVTVAENKGNDRTGDVVFTIGLAKATLKVVQKGEAGELKPGSGTQADPYSVAGVRAYVESLGADVQSSDKVYVKGIISAVGTTFEASGSYGNATFDMVDNAGDTDTFKAFQTYYLGNRKWTSGDTEVQVGDEVIVYGPVVNYKGNTPETAGKGASFIYSLNGVTEGGGGSTDPGTAKGDGSLDNPYNPAGAAAYAQSLGADVQSDKSVYIKGKISNVSTSYEASGSYGNANFTIVDETDGTGEFYVYQTYYLGNRKWVAGDTDVKVGDVVIVYGPVINYKGNTPETVGKGASYVYSLNGETEGGGSTDPGTPKGDGSLDNPYNPAGAAAYAQSLGADVQSDKSVYIKGKISNVSTSYEASGSYGNANFTIVDETDGTGEFYVYQTYYLGNRKWVAGDTDVKVGDVVIVYGPVINYKGNTPETVGKGASYVYSLNGETSIEQSPVFGVASQSVNVGAGATSATVKVTGNVAWTASSENATVSPASGTGAADITVSFAANTDTENAKTYTVTVSTTADVATKSFTVTITQGPAAPDGASTVEFVVSEYAAANGWENSKQYLTMSKDGVTLTAKGGGNTGKFYTNGNDWRFYQNESASLTVSTTGVEFVSVEFTYTIQNTGKLVDASDAEVPSGAASTSTTFNVKNSGSATNGQIRFTKIVVTVK